MKDLTTAYTNVLKEIRKEANPHIEIATDQLGSVLKEISRMSAGHELYGPPYGIRTFVRQRAGSHHRCKNTDVHLFR